MSQPVSPVSFGSLAVRTPLVTRGLKVGVMGGSFNPPHAGHALIARVALRRLGLDRIWWLVTPGNPLKPNGELPPQAARMALCEALVDDPRMQVTGFERDLRSPYTADVVHFLRLRHPEATFVWIMGADSLVGFHRWRAWRQIAAAMPIAVIDRPGYRLKAMGSPAARAMMAARLPESRAWLLTTRQPPAWTFLTARLSPLSSTALRRSSGGQVMPAGTPSDQKPRWELNRTADPI